MSTSRPVVAVTVAVGIAISLTGCGSSASDSPAVSKAEAAISADIIKNQPAHSIGGGQGFTAAQVRCFTDRFVGAVGTDQLAKDGVITKAGAVAKSLTADGQNLPRTHATSLVTAIFGCTDDGAGIVATFKGQVSSSSFSAAKKKCVLTKVTPDLMQQALIDQYAGGSGPGIAAFKGIATSCGLAK